MNHEFVNLLKIGRRVGQKRIGDIEGLFDNRVTSDDDNCIFLQVFFFLPMKMILCTCVGCLSVTIVGVQIQMMISENPSELLRWLCFLKTDHKTILNGRQSKLNVYFLLKKMKPWKVMSRNHAALHFREGRFYLEDTNSSNGTQVNNKQLPPFQVLLIKTILVWNMFQLQPIEIFSGDVLEFGTEVG